MKQQSPSGPVDRLVGRLVDEGLLYFERAGDSGDKQYVAAIRAELDRLRAENETLRELLREASERLKRCATTDDWKHIDRIDALLTPNAELSGAGRGAATEPGRSPASDLSE